MLTLWDLLDRQPRQARPAPPAPSPAAPRPPAPPRAAANYIRVEREMLARFGVRVRKWRGNSSGVAWEVRYRDGTVSRLIESPRPRGPVSAAIFLHEIGHHAIGFDRYKVRCLEEYHAWRFSLDAMAREGLTITPRVRARVRDSLQYAIDKATRRGLRVIPPEVVACIDEQNRLLAQAGSTPKSASTNASGSNG